MNQLFYRKPTNNDIYLNWNSFSPKSWKRGTLRTILKRAYVICLTIDLHHISFVFQNYNNFPKWVIDQVLHQEKENHRVIRSVQPEINEVSDEKSHLLVLPYAGQKRDKLVKSMKTTPKYNLRNNIVTKSAYSASKLSNKFNITSKIKQDHQHQRWTNFFLGTQLFGGAILLAHLIGHAKKMGAQNPSARSIKTTRNIAHCFSLPEQHLQLSFLMCFHQKFLQ